MELDNDNKYWWHTLPDTPLKLSDQTEIHNEAKTRISLTAALDTVARSVLGTMLLTSLAPRLLKAGGLQRELDDLAFYLPFADAGDATKTFKPPAANPKVVTVDESIDADSTPYRLLKLESEFEPLNPELRDTYLKHSRNRVAWARHYYHTDEPRPTIIFLHGQTLDHYQTNYRWLSLRTLYRDGYDILQVTLPFHGRRRAKPYTISGFGMYTHGLAWTNEAVLQGIFDTRSWMNFLFDYGAERVGITGISLGGYLSALLASVDDRLSFSIPNSPVVAPVDMVLQWQPMPIVRMFYAMAPTSIARLRHGLAIHSPLTYRPVIKKEQCLIISGSGDRFTPPGLVRLLQNHWDQQDVHWFPDNHLIHLGKSDYMQRIRGHASRCFTSAVPRNGPEIINPNHLSMTGRQKPCRTINKA